MRLRNTVLRSRESCKWTLTLNSAASDRGV